MCCRRAVPSRRAVVCVIVFAVCNALLLLLARSVLLAAAARARHGDAVEHRDASASAIRVVVSLAVSRSRFFDPFPTALRSILAQTFPISLVYVSADVDDDVFADRSRWPDPLRDSRVRLRRSGKKKTVRVRMCACTYVCMCMLCVCACCVCW